VDVFIDRPVEPRALVEHIRGALRTRRSQLGMEVAHAVVASLANELLAPETDVRLHTERLGTYALELGRRVGLSATDLNAVAFSTLLHDVAKLGIAEWILLKPGPFTEEERVAMQRHTEIGERLASSLVGADRFGPILRHHHEHWDGNGYPDGLVGGAIPMGARIIGIVDAFDAMTQYRIYREPMTVPEAVKELTKERDAQFDPALVETFIEVLKWDGLI
jgi:putative two-component system response regulator